MANTLTVLWWRDIPSQVSAGQGRGAARVALTDRFQEAIDRAAGRAGLQGSDDYLGEWRRATRSCGDDLAAEAAVEAARLELAYPTARLLQLEANYGLEPTPPASANQPDPSAGRTA